MKVEKRELEGGGGGKERGGEEGEGEGDEDTRKILIFSLMQPLKCEI